MKVLVAILSVDRQIQVCTAKMLLIIGADPRAQIEFMFVQKVPVDEARNSVIDKFLEGDADYLICTDDDVGCDANPIELCFLEKDIIFLPTPIIQKGEVKMNVHYLTRGKGLQEVTKGGTGCFILSRKAAETIEKPLFQFKYGEDGRLLLGEDYYFSEKASKHFTLYVHNDYPCHHVKHLDLLTKL